MNLPYYEIARFCVVGLSGMVIDFSVTYLLRERAKWNQYLANSIGFLLSATNNFIWNKFWTFHNTSQEYIRQYGIFMLISLGGLLISNGVLWFCNKKLRIPFYASKAIAIGIVVIWNYLLNKFIAFR
jgi:putative flippase GtrA